MPEKSTPEQILLSALEKIKNDEGAVCSNFELCTHESCRSSYSAWAIADGALRIYREHYSFAAK